MSEPRQLQHTIKCDPQYMKRVGLILPAAWAIRHATLRELKAQGRPLPPPVKGFMLIDTGAEIIAIDADVAREVGLTPTGRTIQGHGLSGYGELVEHEATLLLPLTDAEQKETGYAFPASVWAAEGLRQANLDSGHLTPSGKPLNIIGVLGRTFLQHTHLYYDGPLGLARLSIDESVMKWMD